MVDIAHYDWYIYDTKTGLGLEAYDENTGLDRITHSWLTYYSETCEKDDIPGYNIYILLFSGIAVLSIVLISTKKRLN